MLKEAFIAPFDAEEHFFPLCSLTISLSSVDFCQWYMIIHTYTENMPSHAITSLPMSSITSFIHSYFQQSPQAINHQSSSPLSASVCLGCVQIATAARKSLSLLCCGGGSDSRRASHESNNHGVERHHEERNDIAASPGTRTRASHVNSFDCASGDTAVQESRKSARLRGLERWLYRRTGGGTVQLASAHRRSVCEGQKGCSIDVECACHTIWCRRRQRRS